MKREEEKKRHVFIDIVHATTTVCFKRLVSK